MPVPEILPDHGFAREDGMKVLERLVRHVDRHLASPHDAPLAARSSPEEIRSHLG